MKRKTRKSIVLRKRGNTYVAPPVRRSSPRKSSSFLGSDFQGIAMAGVLYALISRVVRSVLGGIPSLANVINLVFPLAVLFVNYRFIGNSYVSVLAINELTQTILRQVPGLNVNGEENYLLEGDTIDEPFSVSGDTIDEPYTVDGDDDESDLAGMVGMTSPKEFTI